MDRHACAISAHEDLTIRPTAGALGQRYNLITFAEHFADLHDHRVKFQTKPLNNSLLYAERPQVARLSE
jgi:hypothetical protein